MENRNRRKNRNANAKLQDQRAKPYGKNLLLTKNTFVEKHATNTTSLENSNERCLWSEEYVFALLHFSFQGFGVQDAASNLTAHTTLSLAKGLRKNVNPKMNIASIDSIMMRMVNDWKRGTFSSHCLFATRISAVCHRRRMFYMLRGGAHTDKLGGGKAQCSVHLQVFDTSIKCCWFCLPVKSVTNRSLVLLSNLYLSDMVKTDNSLFFSLHTGVRQKTNAWWVFLENVKPWLFRHWVLLCRKHHHSVVQCQSEPPNLCLRSLGAWGVPLPA